MLTDPDIRWPDGVDKRVLEEVDSTMAEAARLSGTMCQPTWIMAHRQTNGRGRRGRAWHQPKGNLAATLVMPVARPLEEISLTSFQAALALYDAMADLVSPGRLTLKWPNDVLLDGAKVAGILLESGGQGGRIDWLSIGIGVNLAHAPDISEVEDDAVRPISLHGIIEPEPFLTRLAYFFAFHGEIWRTRGFEALRLLWLSRAARLGDVITARLPKEEITGTFDTVDESGYLILDTAQGRRRIAAADVFFQE